MALNQFGKVTGELTYQREAIELLEHIWTWSKDLRLIGQVSYPGVPPNQGLAVPMILLNILKKYQVRIGQDMNLKFACVLMKYFNM